VTTDGGAWRRRTAARGLCVGPNDAGVASIPEDVADFTRRSESKASEWPGASTGSREVKATDGKQRELRKIEPSPVEVTGAWCRRLATRGRCIGRNNAGVASIPQDVADFTRRERKQVNGLCQRPGPVRRKRRDGKPRERRKIETHPVVKSRRKRGSVKEPGAGGGGQGALCRPEQHRGSIHTQDAGELYRR